MRRKVIATVFCILVLILVMVIPPLIISGEPIGWGNDIRLSDDPEHSDRPSIAVDSQNNVHVVWSHHDVGIGRVYYKKFDGTSWSSTEQLDGGTETAIHPAIRADNGDNIHVAYIDSPIISQQEIYYTSCEGDSWSTPFLITLDSGYSAAWGPQLGPRIISDSRGYVYIFWTDCTDTDSKDISYVYYDGNFWSSKQRATNDLTPDVDHFNPDVGVDSNDNLHLVYVTTEPAGGGGYNYLIHYKKFDGNSWSEAIQISDVLGTCVQFPSVCIDSEDNVHSAWRDCRNDPGAGSGEIYYSQLDSDGNTLINDLRLTYSEDIDDDAPVIDVDSNNELHIVWSKEVTHNSQEQEINYLKLTSNGEFITNITRLTTGWWESGMSFAVPRLDIDSLNRLHVIFGDNRDGNLEIYYKGACAQDLSVNSSDIQFSNDLPKSNENFYINATIHNNGEISTNGIVKFYKDEIEDTNLIGSDTVSIPAGGTKIVSILWSGNSGVYNISVVIEPEIFIAEANITNNTANRTLTINDPSTISITDPPFDVTVDTSYTISWVSNDPDDDAEIQLFYDIDNIGNDGTLIDTSDQYPSGIVDSNGASQSYEWNTTFLPDDTTWYIYAKIDDGVHAPVYSYSQGKIEIDHPNIPPIVDIASPSGGTVSGSITIQGTANDPDKGNIESVFVSIDNMVNWEITSGTTSWNWDWNTVDYSNGEHTIYAKAYDGEDSSEIVSVTVTVDNGGNKAPLVSITYPSDGATVSGEIEIRGTASDYDGFVQLVELRIDDDLWIELSGTTNWNWDWDTTDYTNGEHTIKAKAKDDLGAYSQEKSIIVIVNNGGNILPSVQITSHSGGEVVSGEVKIGGTAVDHDGNVELVEVRINDDINNWITVVGTTSWTYTWDTTTYTNGEHVVYARARDDADEYSQIKSVTLIVSNGGNIPPVVNIISPTSGTISGIVNIRGTASDLDGDDTITSVQVKIDKDWEYVDGTTDWSYNWNTTTLNDGNYTIYVRAYDDLDYSMMKSVTVYVDNPHKPTVTITTEMPKEVSGTVTIRGNASDSDGEVIKVEIQIDDAEWEEAEGTIDWSYKLDTTKLSDGKHTIRIRVYDDEGELTVETINITVNNSGWIFWLPLSFIMVLLVVFLIVGMILRKRKAKPGIEPSKTQPFGQTGTQTLRCPQCNNVFETPQSSATIQCPYCGLSGTAK